MKKKTQADFLFEAATLKRLKRTGWQILGDNEESVAEHSYMVAVISYVLAKELNADVGRVLSLSLFHDFSEVRVGDVYKLADCYVSVDEMQAAKDAFEGSPAPGELMEYFKEYEDEKTTESKIVHDADTLALCIELKQLVEKGNKHARQWLEANKKALWLPKSKALYDEIVSTNSQAWWDKQRNDIHAGFGKKS